jgi:hypothetical protein
MQQTAGLLLDSLYRLREQTLNLAHSVERN